MGHGHLGQEPWLGTLAVVGLHHFLLLVPCVLYHAVLYGVLALSFMTPWPGLAADVTYVTSRNLLLSFAYVTHCHIIVNPPPLSARDVIYRRPLSKTEITLCNQHTQCQVDLKLMMNKLHLLQSNLKKLMC